MTDTAPPIAPDKRKAVRQRVLFRGRLVHSPGMMTTNCSIQSISKTGARVKVSGMEPISGPVYLVDMAHGLAFGATIRWRREDRMGLAFTSYHDLSRPDSAAPTLVRRLWLDYQL